MRIHLGLIAVVLHVAVGCGSSSSDTDSTGGSAGATADGGSGAGGSGSTSGTGGSSGSGTGGATVDGSAPPAIDSSRKVGDLSDAERGALCDWYASVLGGYGHETSCAGGTTVKVYVDQAACIAGFFKPTCSNMTVGDFEMCITAEIPSNGCVVQYDHCMKVVTC